jgi:hypothetical protein
MKTPRIIVISGLLALSAVAGSNSAHQSSDQTWSGRSRNMELITVGHKQVSVQLTDGRTIMLGIPILVERPISGKTTKITSKR